MVDPAHKGKTFPPFQLTIERGKLREFLLAIGDNNPAYAVDDPPIPPTFSTVFTFWGGSGLETTLKALDVEIWNVLHSEQEYEYFAPMHIGDTISGQTRIENVYHKAGMDFVEIVTDYKNQHDLPVVKDRALVIVRG